MRLWDWAIRAYAEPEVARLCLELQDEHGQCVCLLLWAAAGGEVSPSVRAAAVDLARTWERGVIAPLRAARRGLKTAPGLADAARQALRERVQADELAAEQALLEALEALAPVKAAGVNDTAAAAMAAAGAGWDPPPPTEMLQVLAAAFPRG